MDEYVTAAEQAARNAKRYLVLAGIVAAVVAIVAALDLGLKRAILAEAIRAQELLDAAGKLAKEARDGGAAPAGEAGGSPGAAVDGSNGVVRDAAAGAVLAEAGSDKEAAPARRRPRVQDRAPGNG